MDLNLEGDLLVIHTARKTKVLWIEVPRFVRRIRNFADGSARFDIDEFGIA